MIVGKVCQGNTMYRPANQYDLVVFHTIFRSKYDSTIFNNNNNNNNNNKCPFCLEKDPTSVSHLQFGDVHWFIEFNSRDKIVHIQPMIHKKKSSCM